MSFYATMTGQITYPDQESFDKMIDMLTVGNWHSISGGWLDHEGYFLDEMKYRIEDERPSVLREELTLNIPMFHWRNLSRIDFFVPFSKGWMVGTSTDGCFEGWVITANGEEKWEEATYDLQIWGEENCTEEMPDSDEDFDAYVEWQSEVENLFFDTFT